MKLIISLLSITFSTLLWGQSIDQLSLAEDFFNSNLEEWQITQDDVSNLVVTSSHTSSISDITHIYYIQSVSGIEIFNTNSNVAIFNNEIFKAHQSFLGQVSERINTDTPNINSAQAILAASAHFGNSNTEAPQLIEQISSPNQKMTYESDQIAYDDILVKLAYYPSGKDLLLTWEVAFHDITTNQWWQVFVNTTNAEILDTISWTVECQFHGNIPHPKAEKNQCDHSCTTHRSATAVMSNSYDVFPQEFMSPLDGDISNEVEPWLSASNASPFGWHDNNGSAGAEFTITRGNNVLAQEDRNGNNGTGRRPDGGTNLEFVYSFDPDDTPADYEDFALTNLFYWNNIMHDVWYQYGFDEGSGNFQDNNYGHGGQDDDYVLADAQDGSGTNNANMSTPPDGSRPRMQMFEWSSQRFDYLSVTTPSSIARNYGVASAQFGPQDVNLTGSIEEAEPADACSNLTNGSDISGNIALVDRGNCNFATKALAAQNAGAIAVIICQNSDEPPFRPGGNGNNITIPTMMMSLQDCDLIRTNLSTGVDINFEFNSAVTKDSDLDNGVIAHEYGHGISTRLTGGAGTSSCLNNTEQMGEGWSDWFGLIMTIQDGDTRTSGRGVGSYLTGEPLNDDGIRTFPYTTDIAINTHTYDDVRTASIPHGIGSVWCAMLWEMTWDLIDQYGFDSDIYNGTGGNNIAMELVTEGLKLQPCSPGFVDGRDAIISADLALNGGANECLIWEAFAKRGLGFSADQGSTGSRSDGIEAFDLPLTCQDTVLLAKIASSSINAGDNLSYTITASNNTASPITVVEVKDTLPAGTTLVPGSLTSGTISGDIITVNLGSIAAGSTSSFEFEVTTTTTNSPVIEFSDNIEFGQTNWTVTTGQGSGVFALSTTNPNSGTTSWFVPNVPDDNTQFIELDAVNISSNSILSFWHSYDTEANWDGGIVEIFDTASSTWVDLGPDMTQNGYNGTLGNSSNNDIDNRDAFTGNSNGYIQTNVDLSAYATQNTQIRFFFGSDDNTVEDGWYIDDVMIFEASTIYNRACLTDLQGDNICDDVTTTIDLDCDYTQTFFADTDVDGFGDPNVSIFACTAPIGYVDNNIDCDDTNSAIYTGATEICDGLDNDCNGIIDDGVTNSITFYRDVDGDGFGDINDTRNSCVQPPGFVTDNTDCDDTNPNINPGQTDICNGIDDDCDGLIDEDGNTYYADSDGDTYGDPNVTMNGCTAPAGFVTDNTDCDDTNANINPGATEVCGNNVDDNCDGQVDEGCGSNTTCDGVFLVINVATQETYRAEINIISGATLDDNTASYLFTAGQEIDLDPGFEVVLGTEFEARIEPCTPIITLQSPNTNSNSYMSDFENKMLNTFDIDKDIEFIITNNNGTNIRFTTTVDELSDKFSEIIKSIETGEYIIQTADYKYQEKVFLINE